jgi:hypothetical protein
MKPVHITLAVIGVIVVIVLAVIFAIIGTLNDYSRIENKAKAVQTDNHNVLDNTRKSIREAGAVSEQEVEALEKIIIGYANARGAGPNGGDNNTISIGMVTEAVPSITSIETLKRLQNIVVAGRKDWQAAQTNLIEIQRQGNDMFTVQPSAYILNTFGKKPIEIQIVTSTETSKNFEDGKDDSQWIAPKSNKNVESE